MIGRHSPALFLALAVAAYLIPPTASAIMSIEELKDSDPRIARLPTMTSLKAAWGEVNAVEINLNDWADRKKPRRIRITRPESIAALIAAIDIRHPQPRVVTHACVCGGCITFSFQRSGKPPLVLELRSEDYLRWVDGPWASDAAVSDTGRHAIADWMKANQIDVHWYWQRQEQEALELKQLTATIEKELGPELTAFVRAAGKRIKLADDKRSKANTPVDPVPDAAPADGSPVEVTPPTPVTAPPVSRDLALPGYELDWPKAGPVVTGVALARVLAAHAHSGTCDDLTTIHRILTDFTALNEPQELLRACEKDGPALIAFADMYSDGSDMRRIGCGRIGCVHKLDAEAAAEWTVRIAKARLKHDADGELAEVVNMLLADAEADADGAITRWLHAIAEEKTPCTMIHNTYGEKRLDAHVREYIDLSVRASVYVCLPLAIREDQDVVLGLVDRLERVHADGTARPLSRHERDVLDITRGLCGQHRYLQLSHLLADKEVGTYAVWGYEAVGEPWAMGILFAAYDNFGIRSSHIGDDFEVNTAVEDALLRQTKHLLAATEEGRKILETAEYSKERRQALTAWWKKHYEEWSAPEPKVDEGDNDADGEPESE